MPLPAFHEFGTGAEPLLLGTPHRVLDSGTNKPLLFQLDYGRGMVPGGQWVVKYTSIMTGALGTPLLKELAAADLCAWVGLKTPAIGLLRFPSQPLPTDLSDVGRAAADIYRDNAGKLAFCSGFVPAPPATLPSNTRTLSLVTIRDAILTLALDAFIWHYDRSTKNPNALLWHDQIIPIDHECAFYGIDDETPNGTGPDYSFPCHFDVLAAHFAANIARANPGSAVWNEFVERMQQLSDEHIRAMVSRLPDELDMDYLENPGNWRERLAGFLAHRRDNVVQLVDEVRGAFAGR